MSLRLPFSGLSNLFALGVFVSCSASASEFAYLKGAETLPKGAAELIQSITQREDKGAGHYEAYDFATKLEYGVSNHFTVEAVAKFQSIDTSGILIDGYIPKDEDYSLKFSGVEIGGKYKFLSTALDDIGLAAYWELDYLTKDPHSGQDKDTISFGSGLLLQKYFLEGQLVWLGNLGIEATHATRAPIDNLPEDFEWPTEAEMEIELKASTGLSYRFINNWYIGAEALYEQEHETEVNKERYSLFAGPTLHYSSQLWWATLSYMKQLHGGGEKFAEQDDFDLHLIEKTKHELRFSVGFNF